MSDFILKEDGFYLLQENADKVLLEQQSQPSQPRGYATNRSYRVSGKYATNRQLANNRGRI